MIEVHVPEEERAWLDPLKHSYVDLLEIVDVTEPPENGGRLSLLRHQWCVSLYAWARLTEHRWGSHGVIALCNLALATGNIGRP